METKKGEETETGTEFIIYLISYQLKMKLKHGILLTFIASGIIFRQGEVFALHSETLPNDTNKILYFIDQAYDHYYNSNLDSSLLFASRALTLTDNLMESDPVKRNPQYMSRCLILKARSLTGIVIPISERSWKRRATLGRLGHPSFQPKVAPGEAFPKYLILLSASFPPSHYRRKPYVTLTTCGFASTDASVSILY